MYHISFVAVEERLILPDVTLHSILSSLSRCFGQHHLRSDYFCDGYAFFLDLGICVIYFVT